MGLNGRTDSKIVEAKTGYSKRPSARGNSVSVNRLAKDIKANGFGYVRSRSIADEVIEHDGNIEYKYEKESDMFLLTYNFGYDVN